MKAADLTGQRFGKLTVTARAPKSTGSGQARWECACDCGGTTITHGSNLRRGKTTSCGCAVAEANRARLSTHGMSKSGGKPGHDLYETWLGIRRRCLNPRHPRFPRYGGRGIKIADVWRDDFERFAAEVGPRPSKRHSLDRIDNDGDYAPGNVRWATPQEQADNRGPVATLRRENAELATEVERLRADVPALLAHIEQQAAEIERWKGLFIAAQEAADRHRAERDKWRRTAAEHATPSDPPQGKCRCDWSGRLCTSCRQAMTATAPAQAGTGAQGEAGS